MPCGAALLRLFVVPRFTYLLTCLYWLYRSQLVVSFLSAGSIFLMPNPIKIAEVAVAAGKAVAPMVPGLAEEAAVLLAKTGLTKSAGRVAAESVLADTVAVGAGSGKGAALAVGENLSGKGKLVSENIDWLSRAKSVDNPYLREFNATQVDPAYRRAIDITRGRIDMTDGNYGPAFREQMRIRYGLTNKYAWAVPNEEALATLGKESGGKIVEVGAGTGYWSSLMRKMNADVVAYDLHGADLAANRFHNAVPTRTWTEVLKGDALAVKPHGDRTLFMSFPPDGDAFAHTALKNYRGDKFVYVGEQQGGITGDDKFFNLLARRWKEEKTVAIPNWEASDGFLRDAMTVYSRR